MRKRFIPLGAALLLAACQTAPVSVGAGSSAPTLPLPAPAAGAVHYAVDPARSDVRFLVYKAGPLASVVGYDHVVRAHGIQGDVYLASDFAASSFSLTLPVKDFSVDAPDDRSVEGPDFAPQPSPQAVQGTTEHMLGAEELDADHYPEVHIQSVHLVGPEWGPDATIRITLHGTERDLTVPIALTREGDDLVATGSFEIVQSEFGIKPHAALGGGLAVDDLVRVRFRITAHKA
jgi:polyisoprenoid-binding protein YceI